MELTNLNKDRKQRRKTSSELSTMLYGKLPPQAKDLEEAVLGAIMLEKNAFDTVIEILKPDVLVKGGDYNIATIVGADVVQAYGGEVKALSFVEGYSTTDVIQRIQQRDEELV